jgi:hypothetical protein
MVRLDSRASDRQFSGSHYVPSAVLALAVIVGLAPLGHRPWRPDARRPLLIDEWRQQS